MIVLIFFLPLILFSASIYADDSVLELEDVLVSLPLANKQAATILPVNILEAKDLEMKLANSIGATLKNELGVHNSSFGAGVGQPVIRGQTGSRVKVLQNGLGSLDLSNLSPDHANSTEVLLARRIEVLRGPASLLYGSGAIGGIVNILDNRIPETLAERPFSARLEQRFDSVADATSTVLSYDAHKSKFAWHLDGFYRQRDNTSIAGNAINEKYVSTDNNSHGVINNSDADSWSGTAGASWIDTWGFVGFAVNYLDNNYGVPPVNEQVRIDLQQVRYDLRAEIKQPIAGVRSLKLRLGVNDYQHNELEEDGAVGTEFLNDAVEGRVELLHDAIGWVDQGIVGLQIESKQFSAIGEEALVPPTDIQSYGIFAVENIFLDSWSYEFGLRIEHQSIDAQGFKSIQHTPISASAAVLWDFNSENLFSLSFGYAQRAPDVQELLSHGVHFATGSYEQGQSDLGLETTYNLEFNLVSNYQWGRAEVNLFHSWNKDYIHQKHTGQLYNLSQELMVNNCAVNVSCVPVLETAQTDARFYGFEAKLLLPVWEVESNSLDVTIFTDYVRGKFNTTSNVPRLPPLRYGMQLDYSYQQDFAANLRFTRVENQSHVGNNDTPTEGYMLLDAGINYQLDLDNVSEAFLFVKGNNLFNENYRNASSYLRNFAPEAGRGAEVGLRISF